MSETQPGGLYLSAGRYVDANGNPTEPAGSARPLAEHTVAELREIAARLGIEGAASMRKAELVNAIDSAEPQ